jgi:hypothetical protein
MQFSTICIKAWICKLFALKSIPYVLVALIAAIIVAPAAHVNIAYLIFFYLAISFSKFTTFEECQVNCPQA